MAAEGTDICAVRSNREAEPKYKRGTVAGEPKGRGREVEETM